MRFLFSNCYKNEGRDWIEFESLNVARHLFTLTTLGDKILVAGGAKGGYVLCLFIIVLKTYFFFIDHLTIKNIEVF